MATIGDFGDELPPDDKAVGSTGHVEDHNRLSRELAEVQDVVTQLVTTGHPRIMGTVTQEVDLPGTGSAGEMWLVGSGGDLWGWNTTTLEWGYVGNIEGPEGQSGPAGTVVGILTTPTSVPPPGTLPGTLWWVPDVGETVPGPDYTPTWIGQCGVEASTTSLTVPMSTISGAAGDIAVMAVGANTSGTLTLSQSGWTEVTGSGKLIGGNTPQLRLYTKELAGGETNFTISKTGTGIRMAASVMVFRNVILSAGQPIAYNYVSGGANTTISAPTVTPANPSIVCGFWIEGPRTGAGAFTITPPTQWSAGSLAGLHTSTAGGAMSVAAGYDLDVAEDAARPITSGHQWVCSRTPDSDTHLYTVALQQKS